MLKYLLKSLFQTLILVLFLSPIMAQQGVNAAGAEGSGAGGQFSFSVGQPLFLSYGGETGSLSDGVQQVYPTDGECPPGAEYAIPQIWYLDADGDGFGNDAISIEDCNSPEGYVLLGGDCDDSNPLVYPGAFEPCNGIDNNCDGIIEDQCPVMLVRGFQDERVENGSVSVSPVNGTLMGSVGLNASISRVFTIYNEGSSPLLLDGQPIVEVLGADAAFFEITAQPALTSLPSGGFTSFTITYIGSSSYGYIEATIRIANNDELNDPYTFVVGVGTSASRISVRGNGIVIPNGDMTPQTADFTDFADIPYNSSRTRTFAIHNLGVATLFLTGNPRVRVSGQHAHMFSVVTQPPQSISSFQNRQFQVRFDASEIGEFSAWMEIESNDVGAPIYVCAIRATVLPPNMQMRFNSISGPIIEHEDDMPTMTKGTDFGIRAINTTRTHTFYVRNLSGGGLLWLGGSPRVEIVGPGAAMFQVATMPAQSISSGGSSMLRINYKPTSSGVHHASVRIASNQEDKNPYIFDIIGATPNALPWDNLPGVAIGTEELQRNLQAFPNPVNSELFVALDGLGLEDGRLELTDLMGRRLKAVSFKGNECRLQVGSLPSGMYLISVTENEQLVAALRIIKQ
jgi:hypothetical protein